MAHTDGRVTKPEPSLNGGAAVQAIPSLCDPYGISLLLRPP